MAQEQGPRDARQRAGQGRNDDEGIEPGLKVDDDHQIDQHDRGEQSEDQLGIGVVHQCGLAVNFERGAAGQLVLHAVSHLLDVCYNPAEVAPFGGDIDVEQRQDVPVRDHARRSLR